MEDNKNNNWRFCAVGNIVKTHSDEEGNVFYGTKAFVGGTKVYIDDKTCMLNEDVVNVIGINRFKKYTVESVHIDLIENIRLQKVYKPNILIIMERLEHLDGWVWRGRTAEDKRAISAFVEKWRNK